MSDPVIINGTPGRLYGDETIKNSVLNCYEQQLPLWIEVWSRKTNERNVTTKKETLVNRSSLRLRELTKMPDESVEELQLQFDLEM